MQRLTEQAFDMIPLHGMPGGAFAHHKPDAWSRDIVWIPGKDKQPGRKALPVLPDLLKVTTAAQPPDT